VEAFYAHLQERYESVERYRQKENVKAIWEFDPNKIQLKMNNFHRIYPIPLLKEEKMKILLSHHNHGGGGGGKGAAGGKNKGNSSRPSNSNSANNSRPGTSGGRDTPDWSDTDEESSEEEEDEDDEVSEDDNDEDFQVEQLFRAYQQQQQQHFPQHSEAERHQQLPPTELPPSEETIVAAIAAAAAAAGQNITIPRPRTTSDTGVHESTSKTESRLESRLASKLNSTVSSARNTGIAIAQPLFSAPLNNFTNNKMNNFFASPTLSSPPNGLVLKSNPPPNHPPANKTKDKKASKKAANLTETLNRYVCLMASRNIPLPTKAIKTLECLIDTFENVHFYCRHLEIIIILFEELGTLKTSDFFGTYRVELIICLFSNLIDIYNFELLFRHLSPFEIACLYCRLGYLNLFNSMKPEGSYSFDLSRHEERQCVKMLAHLAVVEPGM
jgi:hypothetical protein